jgi:hypothetical protein
MLRAHHPQGRQLNRIEAELQVAHKRRREWYVSLCFQDIIYNFGANVPIIHFCLIDGKSK